MRNLIFSLLLAAGSAAAAETPSRAVTTLDGETVQLFLRETGYRSMPGPGGAPIDVKLYNLTIGDTTRQDEEAAERSGSYLGPFAPFAFDAAQYFHRVDDTWFMWNWHVQGPTDQENDWFKAYLARPDVVRFMADPYEAGDFGQPCGNWPQDRGRTCDFIYKRKPIPATVLPFPLARLAPETQEKILSVFQYNADGTMKILTREPFDEENAAKQLLDEIAAQVARLRRPKP